MESSASATVSPERVPGFLRTTFALCSDPQIGCIAWADDGLSFSVMDKHAFEEVCAQHFKHRRLSSFMRCLKLYGFEYVGRPGDRSYAHACFVRDHPELLRYIVRRGNAPLMNVAQQSALAQSSPDSIEPVPAPASAPAPACAPAVDCPAVDWPITGCILARDLRCLQDDQAALAVHLDVLARQTSDLHQAVRSFAHDQALLAHSLDAVVVMLAGVKRRRGANADDADATEDEDEADVRVKRSRRSCDTDVSDAQLDQLLLEALVGTSDSLAETPEPLYAALVPSAAASTVVLCQGAMQRLDDGRSHVPPLTRFTRCMVACRSSNFRSLLATCA